MKALLSGLCHPGTQHSWQTAAALREAGCLGWFATGLYRMDDRWPYRLRLLLPGQPGRRVDAFFDRYTSPDLPSSAIRLFSALEWPERLAARAGMAGFASWINAVGNRRFQARVGDLLGREPVERVWAYDTSCRDLFRVARGRGLTTVLDRSIGHPRALHSLLQWERERFSDFFGPAAGIPDEAQIAEADEEIALADHVVVGSRFCADTIVSAGARPERVHVVPYGYDQRRFSGPPPEREVSGGRPIKFLFVGTVSPRKGVHYLLEAFRRIPRQRATLTVVGSLGIPQATLRRYADHVDYRPQVPHRQVAACFREADCFIFPSLFEGGGIVLYEAAAAGLGVIQSAACGDGVRPGAAGTNGVILPRIDVDTITEAVESVLERPSILLEWSRASLAIREERSWQAYRRAIQALLPALV